MDNIVYSFYKIGITEPQEIADVCDLNMKATWGCGPSEINSIDNFTKNIYKRADNLKSNGIIVSQDFKSGLESLNNLRASQLRGHVTQFLHQ